MRFLAIVFLLGALVFSLGVPGVLAQEGELPEPPSPPQNPLSPQNNAKGIKLEPGATLILEWKLSLDPAQQYRYQYWKLGDIIPDPDQQEVLVSGTRGNPISAPTLTPGAKYFWRVRACADLDADGSIDVANECGAYSEPWSFTFLLLPPNIVAPTSGNTSLPVRFDWNEVVGAESYLIRGEIDFSTGFLGGLVEFLKAPETWFIKLGVNFVLEQLGVEKEAIVCPYAAFWDEKTGECESIGIRRDDQKNLPSNYTDEDCLFTKTTKYKWQASACLSEDETLCGPFSEKTPFATSDVYKGATGFVIPAPELQEPRYDPAKPEKVPVVGFGDLLSWSQHECGHFSKVIITKEGKTIIQQDPLETGSIALSSKAVQKVWNTLDTVYEWKVKPCIIGREIRCERTTSETWKFKTTGATPLNPQSKITNKVKLFWDAIKGAGSYKYQVASDSVFSSIVKEEVILEPQTILSHPDILPKTPYSWRVASCADKDGVICGQWTLPQQFTTLPLSPPLAPVQPPNKGQAFLPGSLSWQPDPGASYYQYQASYLSLAPDETLEGCQEKVGTQLIQPFPITQHTSFFLGEKCAGEYRWAVRSCADKTCTLATDWSRSQVWTFTGEEGPIEEQPGLVPCGRSKNDTATPYNEKEDCGLQHLGFLLQNLLDFILWKVSLLVLLILAIITGATSYFSLGGPNALARIKTTFRSFFVGFLILMFAWTFVNIVLMLFGFQSKFFGRWWEISF